MVVNGGTLDLNGYNIQVGSLAGTGGTITNNNATASTPSVLTVSNTGSGTSFAGVIQNGSTNKTSLTLASANTATLTLTGANTYTGATTISGGVLALSGSGSLANSAIIDVGTAGSSGAALNVTAVTGGNFSFGSAQTLEGIGTVNDSGYTVTVNGNLTPGNSAIGTLAVTGGLTLASTSTATFVLGTPGTGNTAGTLTGLNSETTVSGALTLGGTLALTNNSGANSQGSLGAGSYLLFTQSGTPSGSFSTISAIGSGSSVLHPVINTASISGDTILDVYRLAAATAPSSSMPLGNVRVGTALTGSASVENTAASDGFSENLNASVTGNGTGFTGVAGQLSGTINYSLPTSAAGTQSGSATVTLASAGVGTFGATTLSTATVSLSGAAYAYAQPSYSTSTITFGAVHEGATATGSVSISNPLNGNPAGYQDSLDSVSPSTGNSLVTATGFTGVTAGGAAQSVTLNATTSAPGSLASTVNLGLYSDPTEVAGLSGKAISGTVNTTGLVYSGAGVWATNGGGAWGTPSITQTTWTASGGVPGLAGGIYTNTDSASFGTGSGSVALTAGTATVTLNGDMPDLNAITLNAANSGTSYQIGSSSSDGTITLNGNGAAAQVVNSAGANTISATVSLGATYGASVNVSSGQQLTFAGPISGSGQLSNLGAGTTILTAGNTYSGGTVVSAGSLILTGGSGTTTSATGSGPLSVARGATLGGTGSSNSTATSSTTFAIGSSTGSGTATVLAGMLTTSDTSTTTSLTMTGSSTTTSTIQNANLVFNLNTGSVNSGTELNVSNTKITFNTGSTTNVTFSLNLVGGTTIAPDSQYILIAGTGSTTLGNATTAATATAASGQYNGFETYVNALGQNQIVAGSLYGFNLNLPQYANSYLILAEGGSGSGAYDDINVVVVPEPGTWALMLGGLGVLLFIQAKRRRY